MTSPAPAPAPAAPPQRSGSWVSTVVTLLGVVMILLLVGSALLQTLRIPRWDELTDAVDATGVTAVDIAISAADLTVEFDDAATQATLYVSDTGSGRYRSWDLTVRGGVLQLDDSDGLRFLPTWGWGKEPARLQLTLPGSLEGAIDADFELNGGTMSVAGDLKDTDITVSAGEFTFDGASTGLALEVNAGAATVATSGPRAVDIEVSAGRATTTITGTAPSLTVLEVNAGRAELFLPAGPYAVDGEANAGQRTINVSTDPAASNRLTVEVNAGQAEVGYSN